MSNKSNLSEFGYNSKTDLKAFLKQFGHDGKQSPEQFCKSCWGVEIAFSESKKVVARKAK